MRQLPALHDLIRSQGNEAGWLLGEVQAWVTLHEAVTVAAGRTRHQPLANAQTYQNLIKTSLSRIFPLAAYHLTD